MIGLLLVLACATMAAQPPLPEHEAHVPAFIAEHGHALAAKYARAKLGERHPGGAAAIRDATIQATVTSTMERLAVEPPVEQLRRLRIMAAAIAE